MATLFIGRIWSLISHNYVRYAGLKLIRARSFTYAGGHIAYIILHVNADLLSVLLFIWLYWICFALISQKKNSTDSGYISPKSAHQELSLLPLSCSLSVSIILQKTDPTLTINSALLFAFAIEYAPAYWNLGLSGAMVFTVNAVLNDIDDKVSTLKELSKEFIPKLTSLPGSYQLSVVLHVNVTKVDGPIRLHDRNHPSDSGIRDRQRRHLECRCYPHRSRISITTAREIHGSKQGGLGSSAISGRPCCWEYRHSRGTFRNYHAIR